jgi:hypothetical protein
MSSRWTYNWHKHEPSRGHQWSILLHASYAGYWINQQPSWLQPLRRSLSSLSSLVHHVLLHALLCRLYHTRCTVRSYTELLAQRRMRVESAENALEMIYEPRQTVCVLGCSLSSRVTTVCQPAHCRMKKATTRGWQNLNRRTARCFKGMALFFLLHLEISMPMILL